MSTPREVIMNQPIAAGFIVMWIIFMIAITMGTNDINQQRSEWVDACIEIGGKPIPDRHHNGIGNSFCLKPNSILEVPGYETR